MFLGKRDWPMTNTPGVSFLKIASSVARCVFSLKPVKYNAMKNKSGAKTLKIRSIKIPKPKLSHDATVKS